MGKGRQQKGKKTARAPGKSKKRGVLIVGKAVSQVRNGFRNKKKNKKSRKGKRNMTKSAQTGNTTHVKGRVWLGTLNLYGNNFNTATPTVYDRLINPQTFSGSRIAAMAPLFEKYIYESAALVYTPTITNVAGGQVIAYFDTDPADASIGDRNTAIQHARDSQGSKINHINRSFRTPMPKNTTQKSFFTATAADTSIFANQARVRVIQTAPVTGFNVEPVTTTTPLAVGTLELEYHLKFMTPQGLTGVSAAFEETKLPSLALNEAMQGLNPSIAETISFTSTTPVDLSWNGVPITGLLTTQPFTEGWKWSNAYPQSASSGTCELVDTSHLSNRVVAVIKKFGEEMVGALFQSEGQVPLGFFKNLVETMGASTWYALTPTAAMTAALSTLNIRGLGGVAYQSHVRLSELDRKLALLDLQLYRSHQRGNDTEEDE